MNYFNKARWIWCAEAAEVNAYVSFTQTFTAKQGIPARLRISADSQYFVRINDMTVGTGQYADYPDYKVFDEYDVSGLLLEGRNTIKVIGYCTVTESSVYRAGTPGILYEIEQAGMSVAYSRAGIPCSPHPRYRSGAIENITGQLGYTFDYDENGQPVPETPAVRVNGSYALHPRPVQRPNLLPRKTGTLRACGVWHDTVEGTPAVRMQRAPLAARHVWAMTGLRENPVFPSKDGVLFRYEGGDGIYMLIDLGKETSGLLEIELETETGCEVLIGWGEHTDDLRLRTAVGGRNFAGRYVTKAGRRRFTHMFKRLGLRYVELFVRAHSVKLYYAGVWEMRYPVSTVPYFRTADRLHTRIYDVCRETLIQCMHEHYEDCPWREQALYAMDSRNQMLCGYYAFGEYDMPRESIRLLAMGMREDNLLELCAPARVSVTIPSFAAMFIVQLQEYMLFSGDAAFCREMLPTALRIADNFLALRNKDGLIPMWEGRPPYWNFYEWSDGMDGNMTQTPAGDAAEVRVDAPMNCFAVLAFDRLASLLDMLGQDGSRYIAAADELRTRIHERFWNEKDGYYYSFANGKTRWHGAQLTQALAVCANVCPENLLDRVLPRLTDDTLVPVTLSYSIFQFDALMKRPERYSRWVFDHVAEVWGDMLCQNATTFWETIKGGWDFAHAGSLCHGWSAVPIYLYYAYAMGIRPSASGFVVDKLSPVASGLYELGAKILLPDGTERTF